MYILKFIKELDEQLNKIYYERSYKSTRPNLQILVVEVPSIYSWRSKFQDATLFGICLTAIFVNL